MAHPVYNRGVCYRGCLLQALYIVGVSIIIVVYHKGVFIIGISIKAVVCYTGCRLKGISIFGMFIIGRICYKWCLL